MYEYLFWLSLSFIVMQPLAKNHFVHFLAGFWQIFRVIAFGGFVTSCSFICPFRLVAPPASLIFRSKVNDIHIHFLIWPRLRFDHMFSFSYACSVYERNPSLKSVLESIRNALHFLQVFFSTQFDCWRIAYSFKICFCAAKVSKLHMPSVSASNWLTLGLPCLRVMTFEFITWMFFADPTPSFEMCQRSNTMLATRSDRWRYVFYVLSGYDVHRQLSRPCTCSRSTQVAGSVRHCITLGQRLQQPLASIAWPPICTDKIIYDS